MERKAALVLCALLLAAPALAEVKLEADELNYDAQGRAQALGDVVLQGQGFGLWADQVTYDSTAAKAWLMGSPARLMDGPMELTLSQGTYDFSAREGSVTDLYFSSPAGQGTAYVRARRALVRGGESPLCACGTD